MKQEIETAMQVLVGLPFWQARRIVNLVSLDFGERIPSTNRKGQRIEHGKYALHIQCDWRFTRFDDLILGSNDMYYPTDGSADPPDDFQWDTPKGNLYDVRMKEFLEEHDTQPLVVVAVEAGRAGAVSLFFDQYIVLDIFPCHCAINENEVEHWRLFEVDNLKRHFVITGKGIE